MYRTKDTVKNLSTRFYLMRNMEEILRSNRLEKLLSKWLYIIEAIIVVNDYSIKVNTYYYQVQGRCICANFFACVKCLAK